MVANALATEGVEYLFLGKTGAILLGYPGIAQELDVFPEKSESNRRKILAALEKTDFAVDDAMRADLPRGKDYIQIKSGPVDLNLVFAPDGIASFAEARTRRVMQENFPVASLADIIASKRASGRDKDLIELPLLEKFRQEYERLHPRPLKSAWEIQRHNP